MYLFQFIYTSMLYCSVNNNRDAFLENKKSFIYIITTFSCRGTVFTKRSKRTELKTGSRDYCSTNHFVRSFKRDCDYCLFVQVIIIDSHLSFKSSDIHPPSPSVRGGENVYNSQTLSPLMSSVFRIIIMSTGKQLEGTALFL